MPYDTQVRDKTDTPAGFDVFVNYTKIWSTSEILFAKNSRIAQLDGLGRTPHVSERYFNHSIDVLWFESAVNDFWTKSTGILYHCNLCLIHYWKPAPGYSCDRDYAKIRLTGPKTTHNSVVGDQYTCTVYLSLFRFGFIKKWETYPCRRIDFFNTQNQFLFRKLIEIESKSGENEKSKYTVHVFLAPLHPNTGGFLIWRSIFSENELQLYPMKWTRIYPFSN